MGQPQKKIRLLGQGKRMKSFRDVWASALTVLILIGLAVGCGRADLPSYAGVGVGANGGFNVGANGGSGAVAARSGTGGAAGAGAVGGGVVPTCGNGRC